MVFRHCQIGTISGRHCCEIGHFGSSKYRKIGMQAVGMQA
jgi:hypothetical protein